MRARLLAYFGSSFAGSSIQRSPRAASHPRTSARPASSIGRSSISPRPSGQTGEGAQSRSRPSVEPSARISS
ncbi:MAG TPA: hypothetical protein VFF48_05160, partial [Brevundimonas sp.]|nr:hypothetical protein [Brevundimonas sp.]